MANPKARTSFWQKLKAMLAGLRRRKPEAPGDPHADILAPVRRGPKGRSGAAVAEPEEESDSFFLPRTARHRFPER